MPAPTRADTAEGTQLIADNRKARHDYHVFDTYEAGIVLLGTEVKAIREGRVNLKDSYGKVETGEVFLHNLHVSPYSHRGYAAHEPLPGDWFAHRKRAAAGIEMPHWRDAVARYAGLRG